MSNEEIQKHIDDYRELIARCSLEQRIEHLEQMMIEAFNSCWCLSEGIDKLLENIEILEENQVVGFETVVERIEKLENKNL